MIFDCQSLLVVWSQHYTMFGIGINHRLGLGDLLYYGIAIYGFCSLILFLFFFLRFKPIWYMLAQPLHSDYTPEYKWKLIHSMNLFSIVTRPTAGEIHYYARYLHCSPEINKIFYMFCIAIVDTIGFILSLSLSLFFTHRGAY